MRGHALRSPRVRALVLLIAASALGLIAGVALMPDDDANATTVVFEPPPPDPSSPSGEAAATPTAIPSLAPSLGGLWAVLLVFAGLGVTAIVMARRASKVRSGNGTVHLVDSLSLGGKRMVHLIRCGERKYLIGNSEQGINYLASLPTDAAEQTIDTDVELEARPTNGELPFAHFAEVAVRSP